MFWATNLCMCFHDFWPLFSPPPPCSVRDCQPHVASFCPPFCFSVSLCHSTNAPPTRLRSTPSKCHPPPFNYPLHLSSDLGLYTSCSVVAIVARCCLIALSSCISLTVFSRLRPLHPSPFIQTERHATVLDDRLWSYVVWPVVLSLIAFPFFSSPGKRPSFLMVRLQENGPSAHPMPMPQDSEDSLTTRRTE